MSDNKTQAELMKIRANCGVNSEGVDIGASATALELRDEYGGMDVAKVGANYQIKKEQVNVGVEVKPVWSEGNIGNARVGVGINVDTGIKADADGVGFSVLGFGFNSGKGGTGIKTPFMSFSWK